MDKIEVRHEQDCGCTFNWRVAGRVLAADIIEEGKMEEENECKVLGGNFESPEDAKKFVEFLEKNGWDVEYLPNVSGYNNDPAEIRTEVDELWNEFCRQ